jgi:uncharacterized protein YkwD
MANKILRGTVLIVLFVAVAQTRVWAEQIFHSLAVKKGVVEARALNVRTGPGMNYPIITALEKGAPVTVAGAVGNWYVIITPDNTVGMVFGRYVRSTTEIEQPVEDSIATPAYTPYSAEYGGADSYNRRPEGSVIRVDGSEMASCPEGDEYISRAESLFDLVNRERAANGLPEFGWDTELNKAARIKALDMAYNGFFGHDSPSMGTPFDLLRDMGIFYKTASESIARADSPESAHMSMMSDASHVTSLLSLGFDKMGAAVLEDPNEAGQYFIVQMFVDE